LAKKTQVGIVAGEREKGKYLARWHDRSGELSAKRENVIKIQDFWKIGFRELP